MAQRLRCDDTKLTFTSPTGGSEDVGDILSFEGEQLMDILTERYLGESADRYDDIFKGFSGRCELHIETTTYFKFAQKVQDRAQRRTPASGKFTATASFALPGGSRARLVFDDIFFGGMPIRAPGGGAYVSFTIDWKCSSLQRLL